MGKIIARIRLVALYVLLLLPPMIYGAIKALESSNNSPIDWVDDRFTERRHYDEFVEMFGPGDAVIASWPGCVWTDERLDQILTELQTSPVFKDSKGNSYFHSVMTGRRTLQQMTAPPAGLSPDAGEMDPAALTGLAGPMEMSASMASGSILANRSRMPQEVAVQRLRGTLIGRDGLQTCVVCVLNSAGLATRTSVVEEIRKVILVTCGVADKDLHLAGPVIDGLTVDEASHRSLTQFAAPSAIVIFLICLWSLKSFVAAGVVFVTAMLCQGAILAIIYYSGERLSALLIILPPLVQVLTVSGGIHLMNYYFNALETMEPREAAIDAFRQGWLPSMLSLGTTAMGTASLMVSSLEPIRLFGIYGTIGVLMAAALVLTVVPCTMMLLGRKRRKASASPLPADDQANDPADDSGQNAPGLSEEEILHPTGRGWRALARLLNRWNLVSLVLLFGIMACAGLGLPDVRTSVRIETLFEPDSRIMTDYEWLEDRLGPLVPIEVLLTFAPECRLNDRQRMDLLWKVDSILKGQEHIRSTTSALTFFPPMPEMRGVSATLRSAVMNKAIHTARPAFESAAVLANNADGEVWRITAHCSSIEPLDYGDVLQKVRVEIDQRLAEMNLTEESGVTVGTSGIMPLVHQIQGQLLSDLFNSLMSALVVITLTMTVAEAGFLNGLVAMCSNIFPIVIAFGLMGWLQQPMDIGSVMTASIALGIAVDDTLHFLAFFRRQLDHPGATRFSAVLSTYLHCGAAMIQTSVSCGIGLLVFSFSDFVPTSRFAVLMAFLLLLALLGDLLMLPALLLSPCGRLFQRHTASEEA